MENNLLIQENMIDLKPDEIIYRYTHYEYLLDMIKNKQNVLVKPKLWNDKFEDLICKSLYYSAKGNLLEIAGRDRYFGQCWTLQEESDAMWKICSPCRKAVKIKTSVNKIFLPLRKYIENENNTQEKTKYVNGIFDEDLNQILIGKVEYLEETELINYLRKYFRNIVSGENGFDILKSFLFKRTPFDYEKEVRLIYNHSHEPCDSFNTFSYTIEPNDVIEEIIFDPRTDDAFMKMALEKIGNLGYKNNITKSTLYVVPDIVFDF